MACPDDNVVAALAQGLLSDADALALDEHVSQCAACTELFVALADAYTPAPTSPRNEAATVDRGAVVGRYAIERIIGRGGMGTVYLARDSELDRPVAVKIMHGAHDRDGEGPARFLREAQALARLSHPNVVTVLDVGRHAGRIFVAMEFVDGSDLEVWRGSDPATEEILRAYVDAGRGLAAAHAEGIVHRDVKPQNLLIANADGRVRVTDFGLARLEEDAPSLPTGVEPVRPDVVTGAEQALGTPRFMPPEQRRGGPIDARADQFAFCVALYRALYGHAPFDGEAVRKPADPGRAPRAVLKALERGLQPAPDDRFESMDALLEALARRPSRSRWIALGVAVVGLAGLVAWVRAPADAAVERVAALGLPALEVEARLLRASLARERHAFNEAEGLYREALAVAEAAQLDDASVAALTALAFVVGRGLRRHDDAARLLRQAEAAVVRSGRAPEDSVTLQLAVGALALSRGTYEDAQRAYSRALALYTESGDEEGRADALNNLGAVAGREGRYADAVLLFEQAIDVAEARLGPDHPDLADGLHNLGTMLRATGELERAQKVLARALAIRTAALGPEDPLIAGTIHALGSLAYVQGDHEIADARLREALSIYESDPDGAAREELANVLEVLGANEAKRGRAAEARRQTQRALIVRRELLGDDHPLVARTQNNLGRMLISDGEPAAAVKVLEAARSTLGEDHPDLSAVLKNLADAYEETGRPREAARLRQQALQLKAQR